MAESIQLMRQIAVRAIVTENFKTQVAAEINRLLQELDVEMQQLEFRAKRAISEIEKRGTGGDSIEGKLQIDAVNAQADAERARLTQQKEEMQAQLKALSDLPVGSVVTQFTVENPVEVKVGENIFQRLEGGEILVKDGVIQEIKF